MNHLLWSTNYYSFYFTYFTGKVFSPFVDREIYAMS
jgi:hypothetical protein